MSRCRPSQVNGESHRRPDGPRLSPCSSGLSKAARLAAHYRLSPCTYAMSFATATICIAVPCHASFACPASVHSPRTPSARRAGGTSTNSIPGNRNGRGGALAWVQCHAIFAFSFGRRKVWWNVFFLPSLNLAWLVRMLAPAAAGAPCAGVQPRLQERQICAPRSWADELCCWT